jgi:hypothetical protein
MLIIILIILLLLIGGGGYYMGPGIGYYGGGGLDLILLIVILYLFFGRGRTRLLRARGELQPAPDPHVFVTGFHETAKTGFERLLWPVSGVVRLARRPLRFDCRFWRIYGKASWRFLPAGSELRC